MSFITHIDKFFHNSPDTERYPGTPHFMEGYYRKNKKREFAEADSHSLLYFCISSFRDIMRSSSCDTISAHSTSCRFSSSGAFPSNL